MEQNSRQVTCINQRGRGYEPHELIHAIGGVMRFIHWRRLESEVIRDIEANRVGYYVSVDGRSVWLVVAVHRGRKYLKTEADGYSPDNLLALPECPMIS